MDKTVLTNLYGTDDIEKIFRDKSTEKQTRSFSARKPKRVEITAEECRRLCKLVGLDYLEGYEGRIVEHVITDETVDRYGDIIRAKGVDFKTNYLKNPTIQYAHDYNHPPIGKSLKIWHDKEENNIKSWGLFYDDRIDKTGLSDIIFLFVINGAMPANSVGFVPLEVYAPKTSEERTEIGLGAYGVEFKKIDLLEYSLCSIGANPNALQNAVKGGAFNLKNCTDIINCKLIDDDIFEIDEFITEVKNKYPDYKANPDDGGTFKYCVCPECKYYKEHEAGKACSKIKCPECGAKLEGSNKKPKKNIDDEPEFDINDIPDEKEIDPETKPYPNDHSCRLQKPDKYETCRRSSRKSDGKVYSIITCKLKSKDKWEEQAFRYNKDVWTPAEAKKHCKEHKGILFEPASGKAVELNEPDNIDTELLAAIKEHIEELKKNGKLVKNLTIAIQGDPIKTPPIKGGESEDGKRLYDILEEDIEIEGLN